MQEEATLKDAEWLFPQVMGKNLNGQAFTLPKDFEGKINIVIIAFQRWQQRLVDTWLPAADSLVARLPDLAVYELPTLGEMNALSRWFIDQGMRGGIPNRTARHRTITLYIDKAPFRKVLKIPNEETIHVFLVNRDGRVIWRRQGALHEGLSRELQIAVEQAMKKEAQ